MNTLIIYASNSGGTYFVSELIKQTLEKNGYTAIVRKANEVRIEDMQKYDLVILGSCTWQYERREGEMHEHFHILQKNVAGATLTPSNFAVFGLGDLSYFQFCNAVNHLEDLITSWGKKWLVPSLRINRFYADQEEKEEIVKNWTLRIVSALKP
jgi:flavodoxin